MKAIVLAQVVIRFIAVSFLLSVLLQVLIYLTTSFYGPQGMGGLGIPLLIQTGVGVALYFFTPFLAGIVTWKIKE